MVANVSKLRWPWKAAVGIGALVSFMATVRPEDATSSIQAWLELFGLSQLAEKLPDSGVDAKALTIGVALMCAALTYRILRGHRARLWPAIERRFGNFERGGKMAIAILIIAVGAVMVASGGILLQEARAPQKPEAIPPAEQPTPVPQKPPAPKAEAPDKYKPKYANLLELMHKEFAPGNMQHTFEIPAPLSAKKIPLILTVDLNQDPRSGSEFLAVHVPAHENAFEAITWFVRNHESLLDEMKGTDLGSVTIQGAGEQSPPTTAGAKFTGKIYVYFNVTLPLQRLAELEQLAESRNLRVTFRDHTYWMSRNQIER